MQPNDTAPGRAGGLSGRAGNVTRHTAHAHLRRICQARRCPSYWPLASANAARGAPESVLNLVPRKGFKTYDFYSR